MNLQDTMQRARNQAISMILEGSEIEKEVGLEIRAALDCQADDQTLLDVLEHAKVWVEFLKKIETGQN